LTVGRKKKVSIEKFNIFHPSLLFYGKRHIRKIAAAATTTTTSTSTSTTATATAKLHQSCFFMKYNFKPL